MKQHRNLISLVLLLALAAPAFFSAGCSREQRADAIRRGTKIAEAVNGNDQLASEEHEVPLTVQEQQRKDRIRQNTEWTPENQTKYPLEYCNAQLETLDRLAEKLAVAAHVNATERNRVQRELKENEEALGRLRTLLETMKATYREAEASGQWPVNINGYTLSREQAGEKMVETRDTIQEIEKKQATRQNSLTTMENEQRRIKQEQESALDTRKQVEQTINYLRTNQAALGSKEIAGKVKEIAASVTALGVDPNSPSPEALSTPTHRANIDAEVQKILSE